jgi:flagellar protein FlaF
MAQPSGYGAYAQRHSSFLSGNSLEGEALSRAARMLETARSNLDDKIALAQALQFNQKLWTIFQADLTNAANPLPDSLKADLLSLSLFMDQTAADLTRPLGPIAIEEDLQAMIDVNRQLATVMLKS